MVNAFSNNRNIGHANAWYNMKTEQNDIEYYEFWMSTYVAIMNGNESGLFFIKVFIIKCGSCFDLFLVLFNCRVIGL